MGKSAPDIQTLTRIKWDNSQVWGRNITNIHQIHHHKHQNVTGNADNLGKFSSLFFNFTLGTIFNLTLGVYYKLSTCLIFLFCVICVMVF